MVLSLVILGKSLNKSKNQKTADQPKYSVILWKRQIVILHCRKKMIIMEESTWKKRRQKFLKVSNFKQGIQRQPVSAYIQRKERFAGFVQCTEWNIL